MSSEALARDVRKDVVVSALLDHATAHHTICLWDFDTYVRLYGALKPIVRDGEAIKRILDYFTNVVSEYTRGQGEIISFARCLQASGRR